MKFIIELPENKKDVKNLPFSGKNPRTGEMLGLTNKSFTKNGQPWFPIMGEFHFSRYPNEYWEKEILKMKAGGINVVATYVFWIHHEEEEGKFDWTGDRNLAKFLSACEKCDMKLLLRIGPWAHGECRNGGFPDWLMNKGIELRSDNHNYLGYVNTFYSEISNQAQGHLFKDGGCIIGIQLENEYGHCGGFAGHKGIEHMKTLKKIALEKGFEVPYYTATGWGGAVVVEGEMMPVLGAYADAPWDRSVGELPASENFIFSHVLNDENIGSDLKIGAMKNQYFTYNPRNYPFATAELGGGIQVTRHRRPIVTAKDTQAMIYSKFGSGSNLLGYYMYHGGTNPKGKFSTLQESFESGGYNDLPILSYDFQGVIGEYGECHTSFKYLKILHMFINDFGNLFANSESFIPLQSGKDPEDMESLRFSFLKNEEISLLCLNNHQRHRKMTDKKNIEITVDNICFPKFDLLEGESIIFPFNWKTHGSLIEYATAQPLCKVEKDGETYIYFWNYSTGMSMKIDAEVYQVSQNETIVVNNPEGKVKIILLGRHQAENAYKANGELVICEDNIKTETIPVSFEQITVENAKETDKFYKLILLDDFNVTDESFLCINYDGDIANLYCDGERIADWFYTGLPWRVGLKKFDRIFSGELVLQIKPLAENAPIYLEKKPVFENHIACRLNSVLIEKK